MKRSNLHSTTERHAVEDKTITSVTWCALLLLGATVCNTITVAEAVESSPPEDSFRTLRRWDFNSYGNSEGWTIPDPLQGAVMGGSM